jgi:uncharacterized protein YggU (UPF0235/DUF167 family)
MIGRDFHFHDGKKGGALAVRVNEGAGQNKIDQVLKDGTLLVNIKGYPKDLNHELVQFLARELGLEEQRFDIIAGGKGEDKLISILDIEPNQLQEIVLGIIS